MLVIDGIHTTQSHTPLTVNLLVLFTYQIDNRNRNAGGVLVHGATGPGSAAIAAAEAVRHRSHCLHAHLTLVAC